ncbi:MAG: EF-P lysine aminoacylase GenX [Gammaproteobacteria bacterium]|nr:MAG: EF-P lysine aminoacylase GenX [Gammaproteobacteria bacterium]
MSAAPRGDHYALPDLRQRLQARAALLNTIRTFFRDRGVLEVETPLLYPAFSTEPFLQPFSVEFSGAGGCRARRLYLQSSPEYGMKRLVAEGSGSVFQICKAFRNGDLGHLHQPEFSLLEWYRVGFDYRQLAREVQSLIESVYPASRIHHLSCQTLLAEYAGVDMHESDDSKLRETLLQCGFSEGLDDVDRATLIDWLLDEIIRKNFSETGMLLIVYDYPAIHPQMAAFHAEDERLVQRFEAYLNGIELANGYTELRDADEQLRRFQLDHERRRSLGFEDVVWDEALLEALRTGLPECAGVALGLDRLLMLTSGATDIHQVSNFALLPE